MKKRPIVKPLMFFIAAILLSTGIFYFIKPLPDGTNFESDFQNVSQIKFLKDLTWVNKENTLEKDHEILNTILKKIDEAKDFILIDMFLFNDFMGKPLKKDQSLSNKLKNALIEKKKQNPDIFICVITDPINTVYNGLVNPIFEELEKNKIKLIFTNLDELRDSNPVYSAFYRVFLKSFGNSPAETIKSPFGDEKVSIRSYFKLLNFKANHRKTFICNTSSDIFAIVSSFNPHDPSSYHLNAGVLFNGKAALDLLESEKAVLEISGFKNFPEFNFNFDNQETREKIKIVTENKISQNLISLINSTQKEDSLELVMFYLSHRKTIKALKSAAKRGVKVKVLLDANKDAFGRKKNGIPNRVTGKELNNSGIFVKWGNTKGNQLHSKLVLIKKSSGENFLITGSANLTRRNLDNYNLETNVIVKAKTDTTFFKDVVNYVNILFSNTDSKQFSLDYDKLGKNLFLKRYLYLFMEKTGISTF
ncbi:MAG: phospholipase D-like domain-containing protein [Desulforegulaceae bacterium]|nr:phospholipase D-like domain-containing protein [Desulforegulaceae bacterium]